MSDFKKSKGITFNLNPFINLFTMCYLSWMVGVRTGDWTLGLATYLALRLFFTVMAPKTWEEKTFQETKKE